MPRPVKCRIITEMPNHIAFKPVGFPMEELEKVILSLDEYEALRLADFEELYHEIAAEKMNAAGQLLLGERDFTSFRAMQCQSKTPFRNVMSLAVHRAGSYIILDVKANAFLHHMVRNITGSLLLVGTGEKPQEWIGEVLDAKDRTVAGPTAKAEGLYLVDVTYPQNYQLPKPPLGPLWFNA